MNQGLGPLALVPWENIQGLSPGGDLRCEDLVILPLATPVHNCCYCLLNMAMNCAVY